MTDLVPPRPPENTPPPPEAAPPAFEAAQPALDAALGRKPEGTEAFLEAVLRALGDGPLTPYGIERAIHAVWPGFLDARRGYIHPALLELRRRGRIERIAGDTHADGVARFARTDRLAPPATGEPPARRASLPTALERLVRKASRGLAFAPALRRSAEADIRAHLAAMAAEFAALSAESAGDSEGAAAAARAFGDPWRISTDLRRTALGRRTVLFPSGLAEALAGLAIYDAGILLVIVGAIVFVRLQVFTAYHIPTRSMEPTLHGDKADGDRILVNRLVGAPERWDIWVFGGWGTERKNYVKRCVGLPNDRFRIREGDIYVNDELVRKEGADLEALLTPIWSWDDVHERIRAGGAEGDARVDAFYEEHFDTWEKVSGAWTLHMRDGYIAAAPGPGEEAVLRWAGLLQNDLYDPATGERDEGYHDCPDLRVTAEIELAEPQTRVTLRLTRGASTYEARIGADGAFVVADGETVAEDRTLALTPGEPAIVRFSQVDRVLRLDIDGTELRHDLPQPEHPRLNASSAILGFRVTEGSARIRPVLVERDVYYTPDYDNDDVVLGPNDFYMLGDNSENSSDSRKMGPAHRSRLVGRPVLIVWPPARWRIPR